MAALTPDQLMEEYCYKPSSTIPGNCATDDRYRIDVTPEELQFGDWATTKISTPLQFTITNSGYDDVKISKYDLVGAFLLAEPIPTTIKAGTVYVGNLYFAPTVVGDFIGILSIEAELAAGDHAIKLFGKGWNYADRDIQGIVDEGSITLNDFPYWEDLLDVIVNTDLPESLA